MTVFVDPLQIISTLDPEFFAKEIRTAFAKRSDAEQSRKQNYIEVGEGMMDLITYSQFISKGTCLTDHVMCRVQGQGVLAAQQEHQETETQEEALVRGTSYHASLQLRNHYVASNCYSPIGKQARYTVHEVGYGVPEPIQLQLVIDMIEDRWMHCPRTVFLQTKILLGITCS